jgi:hypothetical protein
VVLEVDLHIPHDATSMIAASDLDAQLIIEVWREWFVVTLRTLNLGQDTFALAAVVRVWVLGATDEILALPPTVAANVVDHAHEPVLRLLL